MDNKIKSSERRGICRLPAIIRKVAGQRDGWQCCQRHGDRSDIFKVRAKRNSLNIVTADKTRTFCQDDKLHAITLIWKLYLLGMCWGSGMESYVLYVCVSVYA